MLSTDCRERIRLMYMPGMCKVLFLKLHVRKTDLMRVWTVP